MFLAIKYILFIIDGIYILNLMLICKLYTKSNHYIVYKLIFNSSKPWVGGSNPSWITRVLRILLEVGSFLCGRDAIAKTFASPMAPKGLSLPLFLLDHQVLALCFDKVLFHLEGPSLRFGVNIVSTKRASSLCS